MDLLNGQKIIPVVTFTKLDQVKPYIDLLLNAGIHTIEVVLRSDVALLALEEVRTHIDQIGVTEFLIGAGTVTTTDQLKSIVSAGAQYALSPGTAADLIQTASKLGTPFIPGVATASEVMQAQALGCRYLKFFPAGAMGGTQTLKALSGPFSDIAFCPTGGVNEKNVLDYLALPNVFAVGGTWLAPSDLIASGDWKKLEALMREAVTQCSCVS